MRVKIFNNTTDKTFIDYSLYVMSKADKSNLICSRGVITTSADMIGSSFFLRWSTSPSIKRPAVHMVIQFREQENNRTEISKKKDIIKCFIDNMGWGECQYVAVMHSDVPINPHCHLVINLISDNGLKANDSFSIKRARRIIEQMTVNHFGKEMIQDPEKSERIRNMVECAIRESDTMNSLKENLLMEMIEMQVSDNVVEFNEMGNPERLSFTDFTPFTIARILHQSRDKSETKLEGCISKRTVFAKNDYI